MSRRIAIPELGASDWTTDPAKATGVDDIGLDSVGGDRPRPCCAGRYAAKSLFGELD